MSLKLLPFKSLDAVSYSTSTVTKAVSVAIYEIFSINFGSSGKLNNRNNFLLKLASSTRGASTNTLRSSALVLCYSAAEYCAPVWSRSTHTSQVNVQLNSTMRLISGTLRSTRLPWLPVLYNNEPLAIRRKAATDKLVEKIIKYDSWPIQPDILNPPLLQVTSKKLLWLDLQQLTSNVDGEITGSHLRWSILT